jgi:hypothetical protein
MRHERHDDWWCECGERVNDGNLCPALERDAAAAGKCYFEESHGDRCESFSIGADELCEPCAVRAGTWTAP